MLTSLSLAAPVVIVLSIIILEMIRDGRARALARSTTMAWLAAATLGSGMICQAGSVSYSQSKDLKLSFNTSSIVIPPKFTVSYGGSIEGSDRTYTDIGGPNFMSFGPKLGSDLSLSATAHSNGTADATSHSMNSSSPNNPGLISDGQVEVDGTASAVLNGAKYATATANSVAREVGNVTEIASGAIVVSQAVELKGKTGTVTPGSPAKGVGKVSDPIQMTVYNVATGATLATGSIFTEDATLAVDAKDAARNANPSLTWDTSTGILSVNALNASFDILIDIPLTVQHGDLSFTVSDGIVTDSVATGIFSGILPPVGSTGTFSVSLGEITLDLNLSNPAFAGQDLGVILDDPTQGSAVTTEGVPEPASLLLLAIGMAGIGVRQVRRPRQRHQRL